MSDTNGAKLELNLDELFQDDPAAGTPPANDPEINLTEAMTKRINEVRAKTEATVREQVAKDLGFASYDDMEKAKDKKLITEAGYDPDDLEKLIEPLLAKKLASDPRMKKLQEIEAQEQAQYVNTQLANIEKLTGLKVTEADLPQETLDLWGKGVDLAPAYIATNSDKIVGANVKGTTTHLSSGSGTGKTKLRRPTQAELEFYKSINTTATEEELKNMTIEVK